MSVAGRCGWDKTQRAHDFNALAAWTMCKDFKTSLRRWTLTDHEREIVADSFECAMFCFGGQFLQVAQT